MIILHALFLCVCVLANAAALDPKLVGDWGHEDKTLYTFKADGSGQVEDLEFRWTSDGKTLRLSSEGETQKAPYQIKKGRLILNISGSSLTLDRISAKKKPTAAADQLSRLLLSSAWCSFSYNKVSGSSSSKRVAFSRNGSWSLNGRAEGYSSGYGGTMASQSDSEAGGQWRVENGRLFMSSLPDSPELAPVKIAITRNSNGSPIISADGVEYSMCR